VSAQMLCQGGLGQFCSIHQKGVLYYIYEAKVWGAWRSQTSQGTLMSL
jgi:SH3-like domain-containing protein